MPHWCMPERGCCACSPAKGTSKGTALLIAVCLLGTSLYGIIVSASSCPITVSYELSLGQAPLAAASRTNGAGGPGDFSDIPIFFAKIGVFSNNVRDPSLLDLIQADTIAPRRWIINWMFRQCCAAIYTSTDVDCCTAGNCQHLETGVELHSWGDSAGRQHIHSWGGCAEAEWQQRAAGEPVSQQYCQALQLDQRLIPGH